MRRLYFMLIVSELELWLLRDRRNLASNLSIWMRIITNMMVMKKVGKYTIMNVITTQ